MHVSVTWILCDYMWYLHTKKCISWGSWHCIYFYTPFPCLIINQNYWGEWNHESCANKWLKRGHFVRADKLVFIRGRGRVKSKRWLGVTVLENRRTCYWTKVSSGGLKLILDDCIIGPACLHIEPDSPTQHLVDDKDFAALVKSLWEERLCHSHPT